MNFTVNTDKRTITSKTLKEVSVPKEIWDYFDKLEDKAPTAKVDKNATPTHFEHDVKNGRILIKVSKDAPDILYYIDLKNNYQLCAKDGKPIKPDTLEAHRPLSGVMTGTPWVILFLRTRCKRVYDNAKAPRSKIRYLFSDLMTATPKVRLTEVLAKEFPNFSAGSLYYLVDSFSNDGNWDQEISIYSFLGVSKFVYKHIKPIFTDFDFNRDSVIDMLRRVKTFQYWDEVLPHLIKENSPISLLDFIRSLSGSINTQLKILLSEHNYDAKRLLEYIYVDLPTKQGFTESLRAMETLADYSDLCIA